MVSPMPPRIRPVTSDTEHPEQGFEEASRALLARALADGANVLVMAWENPKGEVLVEGVPNAKAVVRGMVDSAFEAVHPPDKEGEE